MVTERAVGEFIRQARLPPTKKGAARRRLLCFYPFDRSGVLVRPRRLELPRLAALAPQASASTNSAMAAPVRCGGGYQIPPTVARRRHDPLAPAARSTDFATMTRPEWRISDGLVPYDE